MEIVIFDTNAYRDFTTNLELENIGQSILKLKSKEEKDKISALMHPIVIKELLYHVAGERNGLHFTAIKALRAMFHRSHLCLFQSL